jgi:hypothetical protein
MCRTYDIFEKFADGSSIWRACVTGRFEVERKIQEFAEHSVNDFFVIDMSAGQVLPFDSPRRTARAQTCNAVKRTA